MEERIQSGRVVRACAMFGVAPGDLEREGTDAAGAAAEVEGLLCAGEVALVTGPSGGGKSTLLRALAGRCGDAVWVGHGLGRRQGSRRVIDAMPGKLQEALGLLAHAGLADATILPRQRGAISDGERFRLSLAVGMWRCLRRAERGRGALLVVDEFGSTLDRTTALNVARMLRRWVSRSGVRAVCATAHDDILEALGPAVLVQVELGGAMRVVRAPAAANLPEEEAW
jgi:ABC-type ATPase with predicted acetyltransferase domain